MSKGRKNILMIVENRFPRDTRVRKEVSMLKPTHEITVIASKGKHERLHEFHEGIEIYRIPPIPRIAAHRHNVFYRYCKILRYCAEYVHFTVVSTAIFVATYFRKRYAVVHLHNPPDTLFVAAMVARRLGVKCIYDHHDLCPELFVARFGTQHGLLYRCVVWAERKACKSADVIISANTAYKKLICDRHNLIVDKVYVVRNDPVVEEMPKASLAVKGEELDGSVNTKRILFVGKINPQDGVELLVKAVAIIVNVYRRNDIVCCIIGDGDSLSCVKRLSEELNVKERIAFTGYIDNRDVIWRHMEVADVCVDPAPDSALNRYSTFIKIMEYMAAGKPIVAWDLEETRRSASGSAIFVDGGDDRKFADAILKVIDNPSLAKELGNRGRMRIMEHLNWDRAGRNLLEAYSRLR